MKQLLLVLALLLPTFLMSQKRTCGTIEHQQKLDEKISYRAHKAFLDFQSLFKSPQIRDRDGNFKELVNIPVAVHFYGLPDSLKSCATKAAENQIKTLNDDLMALNSDLSKWENVKDSFPNVKIKGMCIKLVLANKNHPSGYGLVEGKPAVVFHKSELRSFESDFSGYLNLFVGDVGSGILGYSPLGGFGNGDGIVITMSSFSSEVCGSIGGAIPYNLGRTATHELGHFFNLDHIWGEGCGLDDGVSDTPDSQEPYGGCPNVQYSCVSQDLHQNYMDYVVDRCMYLFTAGQVDRMENYVFTRLTNIVNNARNVIIEDEPIDTITQPIDTTITPIDSNNVDTGVIINPLDSFPTDTLITPETPILPPTRGKSWMLWLVLGILVSVIIGIISNRKSKELEVGDNVRVISERLGIDVSEKWEIIHKFQDKAYFKIKRNDKVLTVRFSDVEVF